MAEEDSKSSKASRFLKRTKWGKVLREVKGDEAAKDQSGGQAGRQGTFKLNEDVVDFLKPSTNKYVPKIDIAAAKRWPETNKEQQENSPNDVQQGFTYSKPKRRKGLIVAFVKTVPEIIGEGGDDAQDPPSEITRQKALLSRSTSDRKHGNVDLKQEQWSRDPPYSQQLNKFPSPHIVQDGDFRPQPVRRAQTSHNEFSPALQRKVATPPIEDAVPHKPSLGRAPTGFESYIGEAEHTTSLDSPADKAPSLQSSNNEDSGSQDRPPRIDTHFNRADLNPTLPYSYSEGSGIDTTASELRPKEFSRLSSGNAASPVAQKQREMSASEGAMFRRASTLSQHDRSDEDEDSPPRSRVQQPPAQLPYTSYSYPNRTAQHEAMSPQSAGSTPGTAMTPNGPNPFADPKYTQRKSHETTLDQPRTGQPLNIRQMAIEQTGSLPSPLDQDDSGNQHSSHRPNPSRQASTMAHPRQYGHEIVSSRERQYIVASEFSSSPTDNASQVQAARSQQIVVPHLNPRDQSRSPGIGRDVVEQDPAISAERRPILYDRPNGSTTSFDKFSPKMLHSRTSSREGNSPSRLQLPHIYGQQSLSPDSPYEPKTLYNQSWREQGSRTSLQGPGKDQTALSPSPSASRTSVDYLTTAGSDQSHSTRSTFENARRNHAVDRPSSSGSANAPRPSTSTQPPEVGNPAADAAFADFASRVEHMKGVFRLTAEKEIPGDKCIPAMWLRSGLWWYLKGKAALEVLLQQRNSREPYREYLTQAHVDLAKSWWILSDPLEAVSASEDPGTQNPVDLQDRLIEPGMVTLRENLMTLSLSMGKNKVLPPTQSLIQGQDTSIWLEYPRFSLDAASVLSRSTSTTTNADISKRIVDPLRVLPLGDSEAFFCYGRYPVEAYLNTTDAETDRVVLPCMLTVLRGRRDYQISIAIASQNELVSIQVTPSREEKGDLTWSDVIWNATSCGMTIRLPRGFDLAVRLQERAFRAVWNLSEYARKVERSLQAGPDELLVHEAWLTELQYADSSNVHGFPSDKIGGCRAVIYEQFVEHTDGNGMRKLHRGFRMLLVTSPGHKTLSSVSHDICKRAPLYFEFITDSAANGTTAMVIRIREEKRQCRILLVFQDLQRRQVLYDVLNSLNIGPDETVVGKMSLSNLRIEVASETEAFSQSAYSILQAFEWQKLGITNWLSDDPNSRIPSTVQSDSLRIVARHSGGCITDRINLGKGELLLHLPVGTTPTVQMLRQPQEDITMSIDTRNSSQVVDGIGQLLHNVLNQTTTRTFTFASQPDLHAFQTAITGFTVRYDGLASSLAISRRRMVVPIYKKWEASNVRLQLVSKDNVVQLLAFMEDFSHADSLCFRVKSTDVFENIKGDNKHKKWGVKLVDAKFSLPSKEKVDVSAEELVQRRFVNLEGLDYAEEHDDITVGFESEQERDRFAQALPAATTVSRGITLKRRI